MQHIIKVENIKCGGSARTINGKLAAIAGVADVQIDIENGRITLQAPEGSRAELVETLQAAGYPEKGSLEGIQAVKRRRPGPSSAARSGGWGRDRPVPAGRNRPPERAGGVRSPRRLHSYPGYLAARTDGPESGLPFCGR